MVNMLGKIVRLISLLVIFWVFWMVPTQATEISTGATLFEVHCVGCHPKGGNILRRGKTLQAKALASNQVNTLELIESLVSNGKNNMTAFHDRLSPAEIEQVSQYVLDRAAQNWH